MKVLIVGLPIFAKRVHKDLSEFDTENTFKTLDTYYNKLDQVKALLMIPMMDIVYSINGAIRDSKVFDLALKLNKKLVIHWVGTDIVKAKKHFEEGIYNEDFITKAHHLCEVSWIQEELAEIGISADIVNFVNFEKKPGSEYVAPEEFYVLSYIAEHREDYYGMKNLVRLAQDCPDIRFKIAGINKYSDKIPANMELLGWIDNMNKLMKNSGVCIRIAEHDGLSNFVLEALSLGKQVVYKYDFPGCMYSPTDETMKSNVLKLKEDFDSGASIQNKVGEEHIRENFGRQFILTQLINKFKQVLNG